MSEFYEQQRPELTSDQLTIDTPEQVGLRFPVAGIGSRFLAILADSLLQIAAYAALIFVFVLIVASAPKVPGVSGGAAFSRNGEKWLIAGLILFHFALYWGYFTLFETFWNGQTPGKKLFKVRVIKDSGRQITFFESMIRNLIRVIDMIPSFYLVGVVSMMCNRQHKRLGDFAAGTLVVHERPADEPIWGGTGPRTLTAAAFTPASQPSISPPILLAASLPADAVARLTAEDLNVIDHFFARALDMDLETRARLAARLTQQMTAKMKIEPPEGTNPERVLESIAYQMRTHGTGQ